MPSSSRPGPNKDRALADALKALRRPTAGAWYVNVASRARLTSLVEFLKLGRQLRAAQSALDFKTVVALGPRRAELERRVLSDLTAHLAHLGITASPAGPEEVRSTLRASLSDADAAAAVEAGRPTGRLPTATLGARWARRPRVLGTAWLSMPTMASKHP